MLLFFNPTRNGDDDDDDGSSLKLLRKLFNTSLLLIARIKQYGGATGFRNDEGRQKSAILEEE